MTSLLLDWADYCTVREEGCAGVECWAIATDDSMTVMYHTMTFTPVITRSPDDWPFLLQTLTHNSGTLYRHYSLSQTIPARSGTLWANGRSTRACARMQQR